jgi:hypothetical protein
MTDTKKTESGFITLRGLHDAGGGIAFAVAELERGCFWVLYRAEKWAGKSVPFRRWHETPIRREGAEALAADLAKQARESQARLADPSLHQKDRENEEDGFALLVQGHPESERWALDCDAAAALLPLLGDTPDAWGLAMRIAHARPWQMQGRDCPHDFCDSDIPF